MLPRIADEVRGFEHRKGFMPLWIDTQRAKLFLEIPELGKDFVYVPWLATGLGSNPVGLDRGQAGGEKLVRFERRGRRVYLVQDNLRFRARSDVATERRSVAESFATSTLWAGDIVAEEGARVLIDATSFLLRDAVDLVAKLADAGEGRFRLDRERSSLWLPRTNAFPKNTEIEVALTFESDAPGRRVRGTAPTPRAITLRQHHSFVALPEPGYRPRAFHPRSGCSPLTFSDYAAPLDEDMRVRWIYRHRLEKANPGPSPSKPVEPIVYWLDPGAPEPVRSALLDGARWWKDAFTAAGFLDAFEVRVLPAEADPLDVRYNVIQWTHRSTRGWSYGRTIADPRTGEILKGHVTLGSLRVRQDRRIFEGLAADHAARCAIECGPSIDAFLAISGAPADGVSTRDDAQRADIATATSLARLRQLSAHEVGHTLGFAHNFAASTRDRASVMDYPAPYVALVDGKLDFSKAYAIGMGAWDVLTIRYAYTEFEDAAGERDGLRAILAEARARDIPFLTDQDARAVGALHPEASLWDNGADPVAELERLLVVRAHGLGRFGPRLLSASASQSELEELLVPLYLQHRYQIDACAKLIGGVRFDYADAEEQRSVEAVGQIEQRRALEAILASLDPRQLRVPTEVLSKIPPRAFGASPYAERFPRDSGAKFDEATAARVLADLAFAAIFERGRCARLAAQHSRDEEQLGLRAALRFAMDAAEKSSDGDRVRDVRLRDVVRRAFLARLVDVATDPAASAEVRDVVEDFLWTDLMSGFKGASTALNGSVTRRVRAFLDRPHADRKPSRRPEAPPGSPIGQGQRSK